MIAKFLNTPLTKRARVLFVSGISLMVLILIALLLPVPFVRMSPGPTFNVIGERDGKQIIEVNGTTTYPVTGDLRMVTVLESGGPRGGLNFVTAIASWFNSEDAVVPRELVYPDDVSGDDVKSQQAAMFSSSESDAISAAMVYLDEPTTQTVIVAVNGTAITESKQVSAMIQAQPVGTTFTFTIERNGKKQDVDVTSAVNPEDKKTPYIGIGVGVVLTPEFEVKFNLDGVGGPSAGLMLSMGLIDKLTPGDLAKDKDIAGTGTIRPNGTVGSIGGIRQKLAGANKAGAKLFLVPAGNCKEAQGHIPEGLTVTPVKTLTDGMNAVEKWTTGQSVPACPVQK